jgi:flagellar motor protein MotB
VRLKAITFDHYAANETDFAALIDSTAPPGLTDLESVCETIAGQIVNPVANLFVSIIVVGHSDRQDRSDLSCDDRRASEIAAAEARAASAWAWIQQRVTQIVADQSGVDAGEWWETATHVTWGLVFAAAGMLQHDPPSDDEERAQNRRVVILASIFMPEQ